MTIKIGDKVPSVILKHLTKDGMQDLATDRFFSGKKVVMFAVPGAYTPTCSAKHLPSYLNALPQFKAQGIEVACLSVNDAFVMKEWSDKHQADAITMLPDGNATFTKALGLEMDGTAYGMGTRSQRFAMYCENGVVKALHIEKPGAYDVSSAESMLAAVNAMKAAA